MVDEPLADARDMFAVHTMFRREFGLMPGLVRAVAPGDKQRTMLVADHVALVSKVLDLHHSGEDKHIWPRLRERSTGRSPRSSASWRSSTRASTAALGG